MKLVKLYHETIDDNIMKLLVTILWIVVMDWNYWC